MILLVISLIIVIIYIGIALSYFKHSFNYLELLLLCTVPFLVPLSTSLIDQKISTVDTEFWTNTVQSVEYHEYWEEYVHKTCTRECCCTTNSNGNRSCSTETYDCSYCDKNPIEYYAISEEGVEKQISEQYYKYYVKKFGKKPHKVDLHRNITYYGGCGVDGDKFVSNWPKTDSTYESFTTKHTYANKVRKSKIHGFKKLTKEQKKLVYDYPTINGVKQRHLIGLDNKYIEHKLDVFNGTKGKKLQIKVFVFVYKQNESIGELQEQYFQRGNKNELLLLIGMDSTGVITWKKTLSWTQSGEVLEALDFAVTQHKNNLPKIIDQVLEVTEKNWVRTEFTPLNAITNLTISKAAIIMNIILTILICGGLLYTGITQDVKITV